MTVQTTTKKALETAHQAADDILDGASDTVQSARDMANHSLDKADSRIHHLRQDMDPRIDDIAAKAQDLASRGIAYCANTSDRARRQLRPGNRSVHSDRQCRLRYRCPAQFGRSCRSR